MQQQSIGEKIRAIRVRTQTKQRELAKHLSVTNSTVSNWENGRRLPSIEELNRIAVYFGISLDFFSSEGQIDSIFSKRPDHEGIAKKNNETSITVRLHVFPSWLFAVATSMIIGVLSLIVSGITGMFVYYLSIYVMVATAVIQLYQNLVSRNKRTKTILCPQKDVSLFIPEQNAKNLKSKRIVLFILFPIEIVLVVSAFMFFFLSNESSGSLPIELAMMVFAFIAFYSQFYRLKRYVSYSPFKRIVALRGGEKHRTVAPYLYPVIVSVLLFIMMITHNAFDLFWLPELKTLHVLVVVLGLTLSSITAYIAVDSILNRTFGHGDADGNIVICEETIPPGEAS